MMLVFLFPIMVMLLMMLLVYILIMILLVLVMILLVMGYLSAVDSCTSIAIVLAITAINFGFVSNATMIAVMMIAMMTLKTTTTKISIGVDGG